MILAQIKIESDGGPWVNHNYPCPVIRDSHAVFNLNTGVFEPSWGAQRAGWHIVHADTWIKKWVLKLVFK